MDENDEEKVKLLESIRLQDAALSATVGTLDVSLESDSDGEEGSSEPVTAAFKVDIPLVDSVQVPDEEGEISTLQNSDQPSWREALSANLEYDSILAQLEAEIKQNLNKVSKRLDEVQDQIESVSKEGPALNMKSHWIYVFGMPYFKDRNFYPCPFNQDYYSKKENKEICWSDLPDFHQWIARHKKVLSSAVRKLSLEKCEKEARFKLAVLRKELDAARQSGETGKAEVLAKEVQSFNIKAQAQSMVDDVVENGEHDWMQISAKYLEGEQSPEGCRSFWYNYMHPKINKGPYTELEENKLVALAEKYKQQDWEKIAQELGTNRSGYQCFIVYQNKLNNAFTRNVWGSEEDKKLSEMVEKYRVGDYVPWGKVAFHMDGRTKTQVFNRWTYSLNPAIKKGRFSKEEDIMILVGVQLWGEDFQRISNFIKERTTNQVRDRYRQYLNRPGLGIPWTVEDDKALLELAEKHGKNWVKISQHFPAKDRTQVRHRFNTLEKWRNKNPDAPLSDAPCRCYNPERYKDFQEQWQKAKSILSCETVDDMIKAKQALVNTVLKRRKWPEPPKKKKMSVIENDLVNYFRCSFDIPGGRRKIQLRVGEAKKYANELKVLLSLLKANLNLDNIDEIQEDPTYTQADKEVLKAFLSNEMENIENSLSEHDEFSGEAANQLLMDGDDLLRPLFCDVKPPPASFPNIQPEKNIDYTPTNDIESLYIDLPLLNFNQDEVVADRNQNPSFFEPPILGTFNFFVDCGSISNEKVQESYMCPPNLTTLVGLRTYLLNRRTLVSWCNQQVDVNECSMEKVNDKNLEEAKQKFDERLLFLFLWPALMSRFGPSSSTSIFIDEEVTKVPVTETSVSSHNTETPYAVNKSTRPMQLSKASNSKSKTNVKKVGKSIVDPGMPSTSGPPKKRQRLAILEDSDSDPDNPDIMNCDV